ASGFNTSRLDSRLYTHAPNSHEASRRTLPDKTRRALCRSALRTSAVLTDATDHLLGCGVSRRYGLIALNPLGNFSLACSSERAGTTMTSSPSFQSTGVATW